MVFTYKRNYFYSVGIEIYDFEGVFKISAPRECFIR